MKTFAFVALILIACSCACFSAGELPPPVSDKTYTFAEIEKNKESLKDKIVRLEILMLLGQPGQPIGDGMVRLLAKDTSNGATPYGQVAFPQEALEKFGSKGPFIVYARIHVFTQQKDAAAMSVAVGTHVSLENGKATYSW